MSQDFFFKYILVGNTGVGKSAILQRFIKNSFKTTLTTVGVDYKACNVNVEDKSIGLMLWDTAGMEEFRSFTQSYYRSSAVAVFVYDISNRSSFESIQQWINIVLQNCYDNPHLGLVIVGNKSDLATGRTVDFNEGQQLAKDNGALFFEVSALNGNQIGKVFEDSARECYRKYKDGLIDITNESYGLLLGPRQLELGSSGGQAGYCFC